MFNTALKSRAHHNSSAQSYKHSRNKSAEYEARPTDDELCPMDFVAVELRDDFEDRQRDRTLSVTSNQYSDFPTSSSLFTGIGRTFGNTRQSEDPLSNKLESIASTFPLACEECQEEFKHRIEYLVHREFSHGDAILAQDSNGTNCSECGQYFEMPIRLLGHMRVYHGRDLQREESLKNHLNFPYTCLFCPTGCHTKLELKVHANKFHRKVFKGEAQLQMMTHRFTCDACNVKYRLAHMYHVHLQTNHPILYREKVMNGEIKES